MRPFARSPLLDHSDRELEELREEIERELDALVVALLQLVGETKEPK